MPELPEVETVVRALRRELAGRVVAGVRVLGKTRAVCDAKLAGKLSGLAIRSVRRRAKYIVIECDEGRGLLAHLGMTGAFRIEPADTPRRAHDRIVVRLEGGDELRYEDARRFGFMKAFAAPPSGTELPELARLGLEPLERGFTQGALQTLAEKRRAPVKAFLMDQRFVVGVGNIYSSEALFAAGVDPRRPAGSLTGDEWARLVKEVRSVLRRALRSGGSTIRSYRGVDGGEGGFQRRLKVYGRAGEPCPRCGAPVASVRQCGRSTFFCPRCQA